MKNFVFAALSFLVIVLSVVNIFAQESADFTAAHTEQLKSTVAEVVDYMNKKTSGPSVPVADGLILTAENCSVGGIAVTVRRRNLSLQANGSMVVLIKEGAMGFYTQNYSGVPAEIKLDQAPFGYGNYTAGLVLLNVETLGSAPKPIGFAIARFSVGWIEDSEAGMNLRDPFANFVWSTWHVTVFAKNAGAEHAGPKVPVLVTGPNGFEYYTLASNNGSNLSFWVPMPPMWTDLRIKVPVEITVQNPETGECQTLGRVPLLRPRFD